MKRFAKLYESIDATTATSGKVAALVEYFREAPAADAAWAVAFLVGRRPKRLVKAPDLRRWGAELAGIPDWLFDASYAQAGDLAETLALIVPEVGAADEGTLAMWVEERLLPLREMTPAEQHNTLILAWSQLTGGTRFVYNKLLTGAFRVGVSDGLVVRALAETSGVDADVIAHRLMGQWEVSPDFYSRLVQTATDDANWSQPYPFFLAHALADDIATLGDTQEWQAEWKWDGIRAQLVRRRGRTFLWSRGEELLSGRFPEVEAWAEFLPDGTVLDGELLAWQTNRPLPFSALQRRIARKSVSKTLLAEVPCHLLVYDCLELGGVDLRQQSLSARRAAAEGVVRALPTGSAAGLSPALRFGSWEELASIRERSREENAEGLMLKKASSPYGVGRRGNDWWKWKVSPLTVDAVLVYAQSGSGRRAGLYTDYTFAVWDNGALVPFAKAYSGLTDAEIREVDKFIRSHTLVQFGPVRTVKPELVFELAFEGINLSKRHKSGVAVRFPRIFRWRKDKPASEANTLENVRALLT
ncbi:MAG: ATP-dependent DNA ligase [Phycisphaerae bacterium]|nr:ATP-dependent DNA ligase [Gemmatimonadaceae bacterium]